MSKKFWDWLGPVSLTLMVLGLVIYLSGSSYAADFDVRLETEVQWAGELTNKEGTYTYWVVEYAGQDGEGHIHRWREEVRLNKGSTRLEAAVQAGQQFLNKVEAGDEQALGFIRAVQSGRLNEI